MDPYIHSHIHLRGVVLSWLSTGTTLLNSIATKLKHVHQTTACLFLPAKRVQQRTVLDACAVWTLWQGRVSNSVTLRQRTGRYNEMFWITFIGLTNIKEIGFTEHLMRKEIFGGEKKHYGNTSRISKMHKFLHQVTLDLCFTRTKDDEMVKLSLFLTN
jgi:hypothetical protein